ncbi:nudix-type nucleoside diphosphatase, YffH/AdpP family [Poseidonocella pacifica]|uniref:ADP-ribose pyrophosphatase n=1 Tax=Poseidonocella pacifica TaxID=871651 RepID=A0A1I0XAI0_9RHOB|nr:gamma-glutamylcyclotransferase [Poseidonocella pacifica]SFA98069.1 nudix-type nucleoside diphosphatase, YffH/AdpP family [Poseidonocella pacifica]
MSRANLFIYGTLCHAPVLRAVLGHLPERREAQLEGHAVRWAAGGPYPVIHTRAGEVSYGQLLSLGPEDMTRLDFYEAAFGYLPKPVEVQTPVGTVEALAYFPNHEEPAAGRWDLALWAEEWAEISIGAAGEVMLRQGREDPKAAGGLLPFFRARAWSRKMAATPAPQTLRSAKTAQDVEIIADHGGYDGFFRLRAFELRHRRFDGNWSEPMRREQFISYDAALLLPYDPASDRVMLIEQLRFGPLGRGDPAPWVLEPIAGLIDVGEDPMETARREAVEEAGLHVTDIRPMLKGYAAPGYCTDFFHCFLGLTDLSEGDAGLGGLSSENEDIRSHVISFDHAMALLESGEINAMPLAAMLLWLARQREALRASA